MFIEIAQKERNSQFVYSRERFIPILMCKHKTVIRTSDLRGLTCVCVASAKPVSDPLKLDRVMFETELEKPLPQPAIVWQITNRNLPIREIRSSVVVVGAHQSPRDNQSRATLIRYLLMGLVHFPDWRLSASVTNGAVIEIAV